MNAFSFFFFFRGGGGGGGKVRSWAFQGKLLVVLIYEADVSV